MLPRQAHSLDSADRARGGGGAGGAGGRRKGSDPGPGGSGSAAAAAASSSSPTALTVVHELFGSYDNVMCRDMKYKDLKTEGPPPHPPPLRSCVPIRCMGESGDERYQRARVGLTLKRAKGARQSSAVIWSWNLREFVNLPKHVPREIRFSPEEAATRHPLRASAESARTRPRCYLHQPRRESAYRPRWLPS